MLCGSYELILSGAKERRRQAWQPAWGFFLILSEWASRSLHGFWTSTIVADHCDSFGPTGWQTHLSLRNPTQICVVREQNKPHIWITGQKESYSHLLFFFKLNKVFPSSRWRDVPYRTFVIGSQPVFCIFHSWHHDKLIFFLLNWPSLTFIFISSQPIDEI